MDLSEEKSVSADIHRVQAGDKEIILVGTAHVSRESVDLVKLIAEQENPDGICVELDERRVQILENPQRWENLNLKEIIRKKQLSALLVNLLLVSYQKRMGEKLGVMPGSELLAAVQEARERKLPLYLCDRDIRITLKRAWRTTPFTKKMMLITTLFASIFEKTELNEEKLRELRQGDALNDMLKEMGDTLPELKTALIDERDQYLAGKILSSPGKKLMAVVGAGHVQGMLKVISGKVPDSNRLDALNIIPKPAISGKVIGWSIPILILITLIGIGYRHGMAEMGGNFVYWILANGIPACIGAIIALAHPVTILTAFIAAPFTSLTPVIGAGYVTAFVQAYMAPPVVKEFQSVSEDVSQLKKWWSNKLLRVFLAFILPSLGSMVGTWVGGIELVRNLFG